MFLLCFIFIFYIYSKNQEFIIICCLAKRYDDDDYDDDDYDDDDDDDDDDVSDDEYGGDDDDYDDRNVMDQHLLVLFMSYDYIRLC